MATLKQTFAGGLQTERGTAGKIDISEDGKGILTCSGKTVFLRDVRKLSQCDAYTDHLRQVHVARYSPSGGYVASGDDGGCVRVWSPDHPEKLLKKETPVLGGPILDLAWDSEGKRIVAGGNGGKGFQVKAFAFDTGSALGEMTGHQKPVTCCAIRPTKPVTAATGSQDFKVGFYKGPPFKFLKSPGEHTNFVQGLRYSWDGTLLCSVGSDTAIHIFDGETGDVKFDLPGAKEHSGSIYGCCFSPDSKQLLTVGGDKTCKLWDIEKQTVITSITIGNGTEDMQIACGWSKTGGVAISAGLGGAVNFLDFAGGKVTTSIKSYSGEPTALGYDGKGGIYVGDSEGGLTRFEDGIGSPVTGRTHTEKVLYLQATNGHVYSCSVDDTVKETAGIEIKDSTSIGSQVTSLNSNPNKPEFVAFASARKFGIISDGRIVGSIDASFEAQGCALSPKMDILIVGDKNKCAYVYNVSADFKFVKSDKVLTLMAPPICMAFSPDGQYLAIGDGTKEVSLWDGNTFEPKVRDKWVFHSTRINCLAWSEDSKFLLTGSGDSNVFIWNPALPLKKTKIEFASKTGVFGVCWLGPTTIATCGADRTVRIWDITLPQ